MLDNLKMNDYVEIPYITPSGEKITYYCGACGFMSTQFFYGDAYAFTNELKGNQLYEQAWEMVKKGNDFFNKKIKTGKAERLEDTGFSYNADEILISRKTNKIYFLLQCFVENAELEITDKFLPWNNLEYYLDPKEKIIYILVNNKIGKVSDIGLNDYIHGAIKLEDSSICSKSNSKKFYSQLDKLIGTKIANIKRR